MKNTTKKTTECTTCIARVKIVNGLTAKHFIGLRKNVLCPGSDQKA